MEDERTITPLPKALPIAAVILLLLGFVAIPVVQNVFTADSNWPKMRS